MEVDLWLYPSRPHLLRPAPPGDDGLPTAAVSSPEDDAVRRSPTRQHHFILMRASAERPPRTGQSQSASHSRGDADTVAVAAAAAAAARPWSFSPSPADSSTSAPRFQIPPCRRVPLARKLRADLPADVWDGRGKGRERGGSGACKRTLIRLHIMHCFVLQRRRGGGEETRLGGK